MLRKSRTRVAFARIFQQLYYAANPKRPCVWIETIIQTCVDTYPNVSVDIPRAMRRAMQDFIDAGYLALWYPAGTDHVTITAKNTAGALTVLHAFAGADLDLSTPQTFPSRRKTAGPLLVGEEAYIEEKLADEKLEAADREKRIAQLERTVAALEEAILELQNEFTKPSTDAATYSAHPAFFERGR